MYLLEEAGAARDQPRPVFLLVVAAEARLFEFVKPLLRHMRSEGLSEEDIARHLADAAFIAIHRAWPVACLKAFAEEGLDMKTARAKEADGGMVSLFLFTCQYGRIDMAEWLAEQGCDPKKPEEG